MKDGEDLSAALGANSELPLAVVRAAISPSLSARSLHLNGPNFFRVDRLLVIQDAVFWDVRCDFLYFRQRSDPLAVVELLRGRVLFSLQEHQLRVEEESAFFPATRLSSTLL